MIGNALIERVSKTLFDETQVIWAKPELIAYLSNALLAVTTIKPNAYVPTVRFRMAKGTEQVLPDDAKTLRAAYRNLGATGVTPGRAVRLIAKAEMDRADPDWHNAPQTAEVECYMYDEANPKVFWVSPPQKFPPQYLEIAYAGVPPAYTDADTDLPISDDYSDAIYYYVLAQCYSKNSGSQQPAKAAEYLNLHMQALGMNAQTQAAISAAPPKDS